MLRLDPYAPKARRAWVDLRLDGNEGVAPPKGLFEAASDPDLLRSYPRTAALEARLASRYGVAPECVLVTAGADDALDRVCRALLEPGRSVVYPQPTFEMITRYATLAGGSLRGVAWSRGEFPLAAFVDVIDASTAVVAVVSPNNPTGAVATADDLRTLSAAAPEALLVLDAAYAEFADEDLTSVALGLPNTVVTRTLSKAWGLAGLRVGYVIGPAETIAWLRRTGQPYAVAGPSLALAAAWLERGGATVDAGIAQARDERERLTALLRSLGAEVGASQANFVLARFSNAAWVHDGLASLGVAVRQWPRRRGLEDALRISCPGDAGAFERLAAALRAVLAPKAILFDLDGVLADVSRSYREAIVSTAKSYGVSLSPADIDAAKAAGDANDDWALTRSLLASRGVAAPLAEVTERFELRYQGTPSTPGLWERESLLVKRSVLQDLAARFPLAIVTGRPRADAERFLGSQGIADLFSVVVAREDAALKPDPEPVRVALERLGLKSAWMLGDTPDDVFAARAAGVVPLGVGGSGDVLSEVGAGRVFKTASELEGLLP